MDNLTEKVKELSNKRKKTEPSFVFNNKVLEELVKQEAGTRGYLFFSTQGDPTYLALYVLSAGKAEHYSDNFNQTDKIALKLTIQPEILVVPYFIEGDEKNLFAASAEMHSKNQVLKYFCRTEKETGEKKITSLTEKNGIISQSYPHKIGFIWHYEMPDSAKETSEKLRQLFCGNEAYKEQ